MNIIEKLKSKKAIKHTAEHYGVTEDEVIAGIQEAIDAAWQSEDSMKSRTQAELFPNGKPEPGEFIVRLADIVRCM